MFPVGSLMAPVAAGPLRGPRYTQLLVEPEQRVAQRNIAQVARNPLDVQPADSNRNANEACDLVVNIYARTRLRYSLVASDAHAVAGKPVAVEIRADLLQGNASNIRAFARLISPLTDIAALSPTLNPKKIPPDHLTPGTLVPAFEAAKALAAYERQNRRATAQLDQAVTVAVQDNAALRVPIEKTGIAGPYHLSVYVEGDYCPLHGRASGQMGSMSASSGMPTKSCCDADCAPEHFTRLMTTLVGVSEPKAARKAARKTVSKKRRK